jgi:hypothetical protein
MALKLLQVVTTLGLSSIFIGCVSSSPNRAVEAKDECVHFERVKSWLVLDKRHLMVWLRSEPNGYLVSFDDDLPDTDSWRLKFIDFDGNRKICGYGGDQFIAPEHGYNQIPARVTSVHQLQEHDLQQLSEQYHVNLLPKKNVVKITPDGK